MINGIGSTGKGRIDLLRADAAKRGTATASIAAVKSESTETAEKVASPAAALASLGAPVDSEKVAAIRAAIAEGRYPVDPKAIAAKMIDLDLPLKF